MQLQEIDTLQDLILWVKENMPGAYVESEGEITIHTGLAASMGGYLYLLSDVIEGEGE
jgi:hypothetical protein